MWPVGIQGTFTSNLGSPVSFAFSQPVRKRELSPGRILAAAKSRRTALPRPPAGLSTRDLGHALAEAAQGELLSWIPHT